MVIDSSALAAIIFQEPQAEALEAAIDADPLRLLGSPTRAEVSIVVGRRLGWGGLAEIRQLISVISAVDVPFDGVLADAAADAYAVWGKGSHPARLNLGDCCTYAVAKRMGEPILCVGNDFALTDIDVVPLG